MITDYASALQDDYKHCIHGLYLITAVSSYDLHCCTHDSLCWAAVISSCAYHYTLGYADTAHTCSSWLCYHTLPRCHIGDDGTATTRWVGTWVWCTAGPTKHAMMYTYTVSIPWSIRASPLSYTLINRVVTACMYRRLMSVLIGYSSVHTAWLSKLPDHREPGSLRGY